MEIYEIYEQKGKAEKQELEKAIQRAKNEGLMQ